VRVWIPEKKDFVIHCAHENKFGSHRPDIQPRRRLRGVCPPAKIRLKLTDEQVVGRQNCVRLKLNKIARHKWDRTASVPWILSSRLWNPCPSIPQGSSSLVPVLSTKNSVERSEFVWDQTGDCLADRFFQAVARHVYRWCSPPARGRATTWE
jgi:hypothetical protein